MKKVLQFLICFVPMLATFAIQYLVQFIYFFATTLSAMMGKPASEYDGYPVALITMIIHIVMVLSFGAFYYFSVKKGKIDAPKQHMTFFSVVSILSSFLVASLGIGCLLELAAFVFPKTMEAYNELINSMGLMDVSFITVFTTLFLAPLGEEIAFRGITMKLAMRLTDRFWIVNVIQAAMFGFAHGNLVQGIYAFLLGLLFGYLVRRFNCLYASMLAHVAFNIAGTLLNDAFFKLRNWTFAETLILAIVFAGVFAGIMYLSYRKEKELITQNREQFQNEQIREYGVE